MDSRPYPAETRDGGFFFAPACGGAGGRRGLWIVFACGLPLQTARQARREAHLQITQVLTDRQVNAANVVAAFDRATQDVIAAATLPMPGAGGLHRAVDSPDVEAQAPVQRARA